MRFTNKTKRNISLALTLLGCALIAECIIDPILSGGFSGRDWWNLFSITFLTAFGSFDSYRTYSKKVKEEQKK